MRNISRDQRSFPPYPTSARAPDRTSSRSEDAKTSSQVFEANAWGPPWQCDDGLFTGDLLAACAGISRVDSKGRPLNNKESLCFHVLPVFALCQNPPKQKKHWFSSPNTPGLWIAKTFVAHGVLRFRWFIDLCMVAACICMQIATYTTPWVVVLKPTVLAEQESLTLLSARLWIIGLRVSWHDDGDFKRWREGPATVSAKTSLGQKVERPWCFWRTALLIKSLCFENSRDCDPGWNFWAACGNLDFW